MPRIGYADVQVHPLGIRQVGRGGVQTAARWKATSRTPGPATAFLDGSDTSLHYTDFMDPELAALATSGANTMVSLMLTDAWSGVKKLITRFFTVGRRNTPPEQISDELEASRTELQAIQGADIAEIQQIMQRRWEASLLLRLQQQPELASILAEIVAYGKEHGIESSTSVNNMSIKARASDDARVYQQGHGIQHNG